MTALLRLIFSILPCIFLLEAAFGAPAAKFSFQPEQPLVGDTVNTRLTGLTSGETVRIEASLKDESGRLWKSSATFNADKNGVVDIADTAPKEGSYAGIDAMGLFWSMALDPAEKQRSSYWHTSLVPIDVLFTAKRNDGTLVNGKIVRRIVKDGIRKIEIHESNGLVANLFLPAGDGPHPGIIILGGSEGGTPNDAFVSQFANHGFAALGLAYYRKKGLPSHFANLPLEYFNSAIDYMKSRPEVDSSRLAMVGSSIGGVTALLCASQYPDIHLVISIIGGPVLFQSIDPDPLIKGAQSNFTLSGKPLPFIPIIFPELTPENLRTAYYLRVFLGSMFATPDNVVEDASVPVERIAGPILLIGASNDRLFGSGFLNAKAYNRLTEKKFPYPYEIVNYDGVGHTLGAAGLPGTPTTINSEIIEPFGIGYEYGGNPKDTAHAQADSWKRIFDFLKRHVIEAKKSREVKKP